MQFTVIIPARHASTRLPAKPLADIHGKPMVVRVAERAALSDAAAVWVAADDERIINAVAEHGIQSIATSPEHASGTDRLAEAVIQLGLADDVIVVNVQGDEPLIAPELIRAVAADLAAHPESVMATVCHPLHDYASMMNPHMVKVVMDDNGHAMYFSRAPIPYARDAFAAGTQLPADLPAYRHIGLYAYRVGFLKQYANLSPAPIERFESLEQLRVLWHGFKISVSISPHPAAPGVDTAEDLAQVRELFLASSLSKEG
ncbi:3-deoxy-manno-octulosonate cytidylyltransferase [Sulfuriferula sp. AH1]|uniref:3-deoxy-manno-octulosonate cytidylyltransferase n=1 Tax=Sulfuriferula sp. AH1 TaxID=1985873 RepID=UPI000B3B90E9|nr:3-deoxy-manno-octulosonate cytidylyltransferase [Sulfuriferula sp. AH1]ARU32074.1 3-deoxy-manno-octulosonate cytidylyltransferase [Sulfuriferula sp. AH1]